MSTKGVNPITNCALETTMFGWTVNKSPRGAVENPGTVLLQTDEEMESEFFDIFIDMHANE